MATYEAVAAVALTLQSLLADRVQHPSGNGTVVPVSLGPPGPERDPEGSAEESRINLFLYQVSENHFLQNQEIPGHGHPGTYGQPPLSLDLHFLLTVFGSQASGDYFDETPAHRLLGSAMQVFHDHAIITDSLLTRRPPTGLPVLDSTLRGEHELIKLTLRPLGLEDLSNVWMSLELSYRLSVAYEVSVVQVESSRPRRYPRPVQELPGAGPRIFTVPLQRPQLTSVAVQRPGDAADMERPVAFARIGDTLILRGSRLTGSGLFVRLGSVELPPAVIAAAGNRIEVLVPDDVLPDLTPIDADDRLQPGTHAVSVAISVPDLPQAAVPSGQLAFVLVPSVHMATVVGRTLTLTGTRLMDDDAPGQMIVGDTVVERDDYQAGSTDTSVVITLSETLPAFPAAARVSGDLSSFPSLPNSFDMSVTVGADGPHTVTLTSTPTSLAQAADAVQAAINATTAAESFADVRVTATDRELILIAGALTSAITVANGALANALELSSGASARDVYLSGALRPFPSLTNATPRVDLTIGATTATVSLGSVPTSLTGAAIALEAAIRAADPAVEFSDARVAELEDQLCVLPGAAGAVTFAPTVGVDETTVAELELLAAYFVRARVGGAESIDELTVELPA